MSKLLKRWYEIRGEIKSLEKEEEQIKTKIKGMMDSKKLTQVRGGNYRVLTRNMSRETLSRKDCPTDVWKKYCKKIEVEYLKIDYIGEDNSDSFE